MKLATAEEKTQKFPNYFTPAAHMEKLVNCNRIIVRICEVRRQLWRPRHKWERIVKGLLNK